MPAYEPRFRHGSGFCDSFEPILRILGEILSRKTLPGGPGTSQRHLRHSGESWWSCTFERGLVVLCEPPKRLISKIITWQHFWRYFDPMSTGDNTREIHARDSAMYRVLDHQEMFLSSNSHSVSLNESQNPLAWRNLGPGAGISWESFIF